LAAALRAGGHRRRAERSVDLSSMPGATLCKEGTDRPPWIHYFWIPRIGIILGSTRPGRGGRHRVLEFAGVADADVKVVSEGANK
jgi:hypothetical protein